MAELHPDLSLRTDRAGLTRARAEIMSQLVRPMTQREAGLLLSRLNPFLADGHNVVGIPARGKLVQAHLDGGGRVFPVGVHLGGDGKLRLRTGWEGFPTGAEIVRINGRGAGEVVAEMLATVGGDSLASRRALLGRRFPILYWLQFGDTGHYALSIEGPGACPRVVVTPGGRAIPVENQYDPPASQVFGHEILEGGVGYFKAGSFSGEHRAQLAELARRAFTEFKRRQVQAVIIDLRDNDGGDDPLWQESLMEYITAKPYAHLSRFSVRVNQDNADPGDVIGEVQTKEYTRRFQPSADQPLRFSGPVVLLVGPYTYSAAIQFAVAAQDFGIARIAGQETGARSCQTGQTKAIELPRTGLRAFTPVIAYTRPSGAGCERGVVPELAIDDDGLDPRRAPRLLAARLAAER